MRLCISIVHLHTQFNEDTRPAGDKDLFVVRLIGMVRARWHRTGKAEFCDVHAASYEVGTVDGLVEGFYLIEM